MVRPKKTEKKIKKPHSKRKLVNETVYGGNPTDFFVFNGLFLPMFAELSAYVYTPTVANIASFSNLPIPFIKLKRLSQIFHLRQSLFFITL